MTTGEKLVKFLLIRLIRFYQRYVSPLMGPRCRFYPTCSEYSIQAMEHHGVMKGSLLSAWRILRCGPWTDGGHDPVPESSK